MPWTLPATLPFGASEAGDALAITSVTPALGHTGGGTLVRIDGANFALPSAPPALGSGPVPVGPATVRVFFGGTEARRVRVASASRIYATTERHDPGLVSVEVRNVGPFGETIESDTLANAFTYARPVFTAGQNALDRVIRALHTELVRQVFPEVVITSHVDWSDSPASALRKVDTAQLPAVFLAGPTIRPNPFFRSSARRMEPSGVTNVSFEHRSAHTVDLVFTLGAAAEKFATLTAIATALQDFPTRNPWLYVDRGDGTLIKFELNLESDMTIDSEPEESNVRSVTGTIAVIGLDILGQPGFEADQVVTVHPTLVEEVEVGIEPTS